MKKLVIFGIIGAGVIIASTMTKKKQSVPDEKWSIERVAQEMGYSDVSKVEKDIERGFFKAYGEGANRYILRSEFEAAIKKLLSPVDSRYA